MKGISTIGRRIWAEMETFWVSPKCSTAWAQSIRNMIWETNNKVGKNTQKLQPFINWLDSHLEKVQEVENTEARKFYSELVGSPPTQNAWSKISKRIRKHMKLKHEARISIVNGKKVQKHFWHH